MKIAISVETKWVGAKEMFIIDTWEDFGISDEEWDNMPEDDREFLLRETAMESIGFSFGHSYPEE